MTKSYIGKKGSGRPLYTPVYVGTHPRFESLQHLESEGPREVFTNWYLLFGTVLYATEKLFELF